MLRTTYFILNERQRLDSYFAIKHRIHAFIKQSGRIKHPQAINRFTHKVLQSCQWCDVPHYHSTVASGICNSCLDMKYGR